MKIVCQIAWRHELINSSITLNFTIVLLCFGTLVLDREERKCLTAHAISLAKSQCASHPNFCAFGAPLYPPGLAKIRSAQLAFGLACVRWVHRNTLQERKALEIRIPPTVFYHLARRGRGMRIMGAKGGVCLSDLIAELNQAGTANDTAEARQLGCERLMSRAVRQAFSAWSDPTTPADPRPRSAYFQAIWDTLFKS